MEGDVDRDGELNIFSGDLYFAINLKQRPLIIAVALKIQTVAGEDEI